MFATILLMSVALLPAVARQPRVVRSNGPWHTVKASRISEYGESLNQDVNLGEEVAVPKALPHEQAHRIVFNPFLQELDGTLPLPPLRSPPLN